jgi:hypothetical protein
MRVTIVSILYLFVLSAVIQAQNTTLTTGENATGTGGSMSYSVGQTVYTTYTGTTGSESMGVQQPYEISILSAISTPNEILLECNVFPNPTHGNLKLIVGTSNFENVRLKIYDLNGITIWEKRIEARETEISMESLSPSTYFLKVLRGTSELVTFKIIKN